MALKGSAESSRETRTKRHLRPLWTRSSVSYCIQNAFANPAGGAYSALPDPLACRPLFKNLFRALSLWPRISRCPGHEFLAMPIGSNQLRRDNSQPPADLWRQGINRSHSGRATQRSSDYATTWPDHRFRDLQGAANKSNPLPCFVNISTTNMNFYKKIYTTIYHSYLRIVAELYWIITQFG